MEHGREQYPTNHLQRALIYQQLGQLDSALAAIEKCHRIYEDVHGVEVSSSEHFHIQLLAQNGDMKEGRAMAEAVRKKLVANDNNLNIYWAAMGAISLAENDPVRATEYLEQASDSYAYSFSVNYLLGRAYLAAGRGEQAAEILSGLHSWYESGRAFWGTWDINSHYYLAIAYEGLGQVEDAVDQYEEFLGFWKDADHDLVEVRDATTRLARLKSAG
jgi:predicted Zn-dependent protease